MWLATIQPYYFTDICRECSEYLSSLYRIFGYELYRIVIYYSALRKKKYTVRYVTACIVVDIYRRLGNKAAGPSETVVVLHHITRHNIPEDRDLH